MILLCTLEVYVQGGGLCICDSSSLPRARSLSLLSLLLCLCVCVGDRSQSGESESSLAHVAPGLSVLPLSPLSSLSPLILVRLRPLIRSSFTMGAKDKYAALGSLS